VRIGETKCKSLINRSRISGVDYAINPYVGCGHGCLYCYARFTGRWSHGGERWGSFVDVKTNAVECVKREAPRRRGVILISSVTDPYQPIERERRATARILEALADYDPPLMVLSKSDLVKRDVSLLGRFSQVEVGETITTLDDKVRRVFEPGAPPSERRIQALEEFSEVGIPTYAFLGPILPLTTLEAFEELVDSVAGVVNRVLLDRLNMRPDVAEPVERAVRRFFPAKAPEFREAVQTASTYYSRLKIRAMRVFEERSLEYEILF